MMLILCLMAYSMGLFKPFATYVAYSFNVDYISGTLCVQKNETNNCCRGKCYLSSQLKKETKEESQQKVPTVKTLQEEMTAESLALLAPQQSSRVQFAVLPYNLVTATKCIAVPPPQPIV